jgi:hypothetical protein
VQGLFARNALTSEELVKYYLRRIQRYDVDKLNSMTELNPDALEIAKALDAERRAGRVRGPLHGTVAVLKDIIGTGDKMHNTGGAKALRDAQSDRDAFAVKRLRDAGVVLLGKSSVTELANFIAYSQKNGYSTLGGQIVNPYNPDSEVAGSSTGSAVAVAATGHIALGEDSGDLLLPATPTAPPRSGPVGWSAATGSCRSSARMTLGPMAGMSRTWPWSWRKAATDPNDPITIAACARARLPSAQRRRTARQGWVCSVRCRRRRGDQHGHDDRAANAGQVVPLSACPASCPDLHELDPITAYWVKSPASSISPPTRRSRPA